MIKRLLSLSTHLQPKVNSRHRPTSQCVACLSSICGYGLCQDCLADLPVNAVACRQCALPLPDLPLTSAYCGECLADPPAFDRVVAPWRYQFPVNRLISRYKYRQQRALGMPLIRALADTLSGELEANPALRPDLLIPSPMHAAKQRRRQFNQAEDIAEQVGRTLAIPWGVTRATRCHPGTAQSGLDRRERLVNLRGAFTVNGPVPAHVAIIDDVVTTGATARTLARALRQAGAVQIQVWALARTPG
ncbi:MAG: ComF family protein [Marinobacter sp.]|nr:ComF family protein [Marinobacter sp.]